MDCFRLGWVICGDLVVGWGTEMTVLSCLAFRVFGFGVGSTRGSVLGCAILGLEFWACVGFGYNLGFWMLCRVDIIYVLGALCWFPCGLDDLGCLCFSRSFNVCGFYVVLRGLTCLLEIMWGVPFGWFGFRLCYLGLRFWHC